MVTDLKSVGCHSPRGSNPLLSARLYPGRLPNWEAAFAKDPALAEQATSAGPLAAESDIDELEVPE